MIWLLMFLLVLWVILAILGFVVKGLMWLAWVAIILVVITLIIGFVAGIFSGGWRLNSFSSRAAVCVSPKRTTPQLAHTFARLGNVRANCCHDFFVSSALAYL